MEKLFRLEFNEKQQHFHHAYPLQYTKPNTHGWHTITDFCSDDEWYIFEAYVNRTKKRKLTLSYVLKSFFELQGFYSNLHEYKMQICKI